MKNWIKEAREFFGFCAMATAFIAAVSLVVLLCVSALSFAWDCDAAVERWEDARTECVASGGHWRGQPIEEFCDGHMMIVPRGECWSDVGVNLDIE